MIHLTTFFAATCPTGNSNNYINPSGLPQTCAGPGELNTILTILFTIIGSLALLMLVISGFRYVISSGDPQKTAEIRRQMGYIVAGLIIAASADAIVNVVLNKAG